MTITEKIDIKRKKIAKNNEQIQQLKVKNKQLENDVDLLIAAEVKRNMNVLNVPIENMSEMLENLSKKGTDNND